MSETAYKVLYRKYRPNNFSEVVGQDTITETLKASIKNKTFAHAYVFTGPRGTGKTSTAKIMAKALNCENPIDGEPCGKCRCCQDFTTSPDIIEIDAASNNGVDEIRELRNNVMLSPGESKYKIYIIDEVHMLSAGAFNALLKTLEEPPGHAVFILATTEVYKIPITILSRCQRYDFNKISKQDMLSHLKDICFKEKISCDEAALDEIYELSDGCLRDALSILDQLSKGDKKITSENIAERYNLVSDKKIDELFKKIVKSNSEEVINILNQFQDNGMNPQKLIKKILKFLEKKCIEIKSGVNKEFSFIKVKKLMIALNDIYIDARINDNVYSMVILAILDLMDDQVIEKDKPDIKTSPLSIVDIRINNCFESADKESLQKITALWNSLLKDKLSELDVSEYKPVASSNKHVIFTSEDESLVNLFNMKSEDVEKMLKKAKMQVKVVAITESRWKDEKEKYKANVKKGYKYKYIEEPEKKITDDAEIKELFEDKLIEVS